MLSLVCLSRCWLYSWLQRFGWQQQGSTNAMSSFASAAGQRSRLCLCLPLCWLRRIRSPGRPSIHEGIVEALEERVSAVTGEDLYGRVTLTVNHSHSAPANFDKGVTWFLGGDRFNNCR